MVDHSQLTEAEYLAQYNVQDFDAPLCTVDVVPFRFHNHRLQVLTCLRHQHPAKEQWALPGGFIDISQDDNLDTTAQRKLAAKIGTEAPYLEQVQTVGNQQRDPRGWSITVVYYALFPGSAANQVLLPDTRWLTLQGNTVGQLLAFDHNQLISVALERLQNKVQYTSLPVYLLPECFTLADISDVFLAILGKTPPMRSIRNRFLNEDLLEDTGEKRYGSNRPATLYRLKKTAVAQFYNRLYHTTQ
ncbi:NUDIX hydrolase [Spartinivicinus poritis]|uniref:NUDIX domain-containing protein n=1 Tax=Spartinivicinus poritis TaxID=2994640 RepID=A0ABT5UEP4_9GAMM|nr:NUDIX domain-containing protein [Spartinivicinus sp. A2-2]MDE1464846.1 NUDIX domain-containing protein [Spartinivicinus sp. A2-2]